MLVQRTSFTFRSNLIRAQTLSAIPSASLHRVRPRATAIILPLTPPPPTPTRRAYSFVTAAAQASTTPNLQPGSQFNSNSQPPSSPPASATMEGVKSGPLFAEMAGRIHPQLLNALGKMDYTHMTPVQDKVLHLPSFTEDCLVQAKTGTGKTIAFLLPALHNLMTSKNLNREKVGILVLAPTRELAQQIADECDRLTSQCKPPLECHLAVGGSSRKANMNKFLTGKPTILVATPGRLIDYLTEPAPRDKLDQVRCVILDEADRMLDQGFLPDLLSILSNLPPKSDGWQGMCFSATMPPTIDKVLHHVLKTGYTKISTLSENDTPTVDAIPQTFIQVKDIEEVFPLLHNILSCERIDNPSLKAIIFSSTARQAGLMYHIFGPSGGAGPGKLPVFQMHSRMSQTQRNRTVEEFKATDRGLLFASDVVGRGMDFPDINLVVQIGLPLDKEQYVHRVGRTGRAGKQGRATMILIPEEMNFIHANKKFPIKKIEFEHPKSSEIPSAEIVKKALERIPDETKAQAYVAFLGFFKTLKRVHRMEADAVVKLANRFAEAAMHMDEQPALEPSTVTKMGLKGVPGLVIQGRNGVPVSATKRRTQRGGPGKKNDVKKAVGASAGSSSGPSLQSPGPAKKRPRRG